MDVILSPGGFAIHQLSHGRVVREALVADPTVSQPELLGLGWVGAAGLCGHGLVHGYRAARGRWSALWDFPEVLPARSEGLNLSHPHCFGGQSSFKCDGELSGGHPLAMPTANLTSSGSPLRNLSTSFTTGSTTTVDDWALGWSQRLPTLE